VSGVNEAVAHRVRAEYAERGGHVGAYRRYCELMTQESGRPEVCSWLEFAKWWLRRDREAQEGRT